MAEARGSEPGGSRLAGANAPSSARPSVSEAERGYRAIEDYAAIGDCHGAALVAGDGGIDWACFGRFDAEPACDRLLDARRGTHLSVHPCAPFESKRAYAFGTNILRTELTCASGRIALVDFMPVGRRPGARAHDYVSLSAPGWLVRRIEGVEGKVEIEVVARLAAAAPALSSDIALAAGPDGSLQGRAIIAQGERRYVVLAPPGDAVSHARIDSLHDITHAFWSEWIGYCRYRGPYRAMVERSALVLKLMTWAPSGAPVAALTTSLPESIGGARNWDYRYCWIRDASLALHALSMLGYSGEARCFFEFLRKSLEEGVEKLPVMLGVNMERELVERTLDSLDGWRGSRPVRLGNAAYLQRQSDLYGYLLEGAAVYRALAGKLTDADQRRIERIVEFIGGCWHEPDVGLWEMRGEPRHFVHSKAMCWVVVDRAIALLGERADWLELRARMRQALLERGVDARRGHFVQVCGDGAQAAPGAAEACDGAGAAQGEADAAPAESAPLDAALLLLTTLGLPADAGLLCRTREAVERELADGDLLLRYLPGDDGLAGDEGAFLVCSFWRIDALLHERLETEARASFERLLALANDVGLYAEQVDCRSGAFLGNVPQAFTHLGLINSAVNLELTRRHGTGALAGGPAARAKRIARATFGWRGVLAAFLQTGRLALRSSRRSQLGSG